MAQVLSQALCNYGPVLPQLFLVTEEAPCIGWLQLEQVQLLVAPSQLACRHVVLDHSSWQKLPSQLTLTGNLPSR